MIKILLSLILIVFLSISFDDNLEGKQSIFASYLFADKILEANIESL